MTKQDFILLALDTFSAADWMARALRSAEYEARIVQDQSELSEAIQKTIPALIVVGDTFDGADGFALSAEILERFPTLPIILYVENSAPTLAQRAVRAGIGGYLDSSATPETLVEETRRALFRARRLGDWLRGEVKRTTASLEKKAQFSESERNKLTAILANIQDGILVLDETHHILLANKTVSEIFRLNGNPLVGRHVKDAIQNADLSALVDRADDDILKYHEINFPDGRVYNAQYTPLPRIGGAITMQDISYLKEIDNLKSDFVHTVSHDLRSPLTAVLGYMELAERAGPLNEAQKEYFERLRASVQHITNLVNELLDLGRLESGIDARRENVDLENIVKYSLTIFEDQIKKKNLKLFYQTEGVIKPLHANPIRIRQMIDNLIGNAVKYTPPDGSISLTIEAQEDQIILSVGDSGPGIPVEEQSRVFEKFFRASNRPDHVEGSGLGLAIVKSIVDSHQGRVWVESKVGVGSTFIVLLPANSA
ncbi:MAG: response regulator [Anaerolineales bacterium]|nr:response regulator [Anaerolineales bacterium]